jgi:phosphoribosylformimino-5-aminoimidazole carboxamide ribonucleotide (ProFAR) isomerase
VKIFPAIDLKGNKCVRLSKGEDNTSVVFNENPVEQAKYFEDQGCKRLHLVDLDSAFGRNNINNKTIQNIRNAISIPIQIGNRASLKEYAQDVWITTQVRGLAAKTIGLRSMAYNFETIQGKVYVVGITSRPKQLEALIDVAKTVKGVTEIVNYVIIKE